MKFAVFMLLLLPLTLLAQAPDTLWTRAYGGAGDDQGIGCVDAGGASTIVTGWDASHGNGSKDVVVMRVRDTGDRDWVRYYGRASTDEAYSVVKIDDDAFAVGGWTTVSGTPGGQFYLLRIDGHGDTLWTRHYGGSGTQKCYDLVETSSDNGFALVGSTLSGSNENVLLIRVNSNGDSLWSRTYGGADTDVGWSIVETADGGLLIAGYTDSYGAGGGDIYVIRTDALGNALWTRTLGGAQFESAYYVNNTADGGYVIAGYTVSYRQSGSYNAWFIKINDSGTTLWTSVIRSTTGGTSVGSSICEKQDGDFIVTGHGAGIGGGADAWIAELTSIGTAVWAKQVGGNSSDYGREAIAKPDGTGYVVVGNTFSFGAGNTDVYLLYLEGDVPLSVELTSFEATSTADGVRLAFETASELDNDCFEIWRARDGDFSKLTEVPSRGNSGTEHRYSYLDRTVVAGVTYRYYLADISINNERTEHRDRTVTLMYSPLSFVPGEYDIAAYPNPFNPATTVEYSLPVNGRVVVAVYDLGGRLQRELVNENLEAGLHRAVFSAGDLSSGVYLVQMRSGSIQRTQKVLLLK